MTFAHLSAALEAPLRFTDLASHDLQRLGTINAFHQDQQGFMWLAGAQGLARFDGYELKTFADAERVEAAKFVYAIAADSDDGLWLASDAGLGFLNPAREGLRMLRPSQAGFSDVVQTLAPWPGGQWLLGTDRGALLFDPATERFSAVPNTAALNISAMAIDSSGAAWFGTRGAGLYRFTNLAERPARYTSAGGLCGDTVLTLAIAPEDQTLWVGTLGDGVCSFDRVRRVFETESLPSTDTVWDIQFDRAGGLWLATDRGGLQWRREPGAGWRAFKPDTHDRETISSANLRALFEDRLGDLWVSRFPWGIAHHRKSTRAITRLRHHPQSPQTLSDSGILTLHQSPHDQGLWIGTERGLNRLTAEGVTRIAGPVADATVLSLADAADGELWVGTWSKGLLRYSPEGTVTAHHPGRGGSADISDRFVWALHRGSAGELWAGTEVGGLNRIDPDGTVAHWRQADGAPDLPSDFVRSLIPGHGGRVWLGTAAGALSFDPETGAVQLMGDRHRVRDILLRGAEVWVATQDAGVQIYSANGTWRGAVTTQNNLPSNAVAAIAADASGHVWAATAEGLARITEGSVDQVLTHASGLAGNLHNREALLVDASGRIYAGSNAGLSVFHPDDLAPAPAPHIVITGIEIPGRDHLPPSAKVAARLLTLAPDEDRFAVGFAVLDFADPHSYEYGYRLTGRDQPWLSAPNRRATFTHLPQGRHRLDLRVRGVGQPWHVQTDVLTVEVTAPWWRTRWAIAGYAIALLLAVWLAKRLLELHYRWRFLEEAAVTDPLTRVYNRTGIERVFERLRADPQRLKPAAIILVGIDHFKRINDRRGHDAGDRVLMGVAKSLQNCLRHRDALGRWGGEEFIAICNGADLTGALRLAERIRAAIAATPFESPTDALQVTVSVGVADLIANEDPKDAAQRAGEALLNARHGGRNCVMRAERERAPAAAGPLLTPGYAPPR